MKLTGIIFLATIATTVVAKDPTKCGKLGEKRCSMSR